jgi:Beta-propeller repeat
MTIQEGPAPPLKRDMIPSSLPSYGPKFAHDAREYSVVRMKLTGSRLWSDVTGLDPTGGVSNYLPSAGARLSLTKIPHYARVSVAGVYKGVDLVFYSHGGNLEYDFVVAPGADPKKIQLAFEGTKQIRVDAKSGDLVLTTAGGSELHQVRPKVYQQVGEQRNEIAGGYALLGQQHVALSVASYDRRHELVIDPTVSFATDFGYAISESVSAVAVDSFGNSYVTGTTDRKNFPVTNGSKWVNNDCGSTFPIGFCSHALDIFVAKLSPTGTILFATYVGSGSGNGIAVDSTGVYVTGGEYKPDIDNVIGYAGGLDIFALKLSPAGEVIYKNIFGTEKDDVGQAIAVDSQHNAWIAGWTNGIEPKADVQIIKVGPTGLFLRGQVYAAAGNSIAYGIAVDPADQPWITGQTCGSGFPVTNGSDSSSLCKVFVLQLEGLWTPSIVTRMSMVFGGSIAGDTGYAIVPNGSNAAYVTGATNAPNFPTTLGAYQTAKLSRGPSAFVTEVDDANFTGRVVRSTLLGSSVDTVGQAIASIDAAAVYVGGYTETSSGFIQKLKFDLTQSAYTKTLFSRVNGLAVLKPSAVSGLPEIYAGGDDAKHYSQVAKLDDDVVQSQVLWHNTATGQLTAWILDEQGRVRQQRHYRRSALPLPVVRRAGR